MGIELAFQKEAKNEALSRKELEELCSGLVQQANEAGGEDNITALAIRIEEVEQAPSSRRSTEPGPVSVSDASNATAKSAGT